MVAGGTLVAVSPLLFTLEALSAISLGVVNLMGANKENHLPLGRASGVALVGGGGLVVGSLIYGVITQNAQEAEQRARSTRKPLVEVPVLASDVGSEG